MSALVLSNVSFLKKTLSQHFFYHCTTFTRFDRKIVEHLKKKKKKDQQAGHIAWIFYINAIAFCKSILNKPLRNRPNV